MENKISDPCSEDHTPGVTQVIALVIVSPTAE